MLLQMNLHRQLDLRLTKVCKHNNFQMSLLIHYIFAEQRDLFNKLDVRYTLLSCTTSYTDVKIWKICTRKWLTYELHLVEVGTEYHPEGYSCSHHCTMTNKTSWTELKCQNQEKNENSQECLTSELLISNLRVDNPRNQTNQDLRHFCWNQNKTICSSVISPSENILC